MVPAFLKPPASSFSSSNRIDRCSRKRFFLRPSRSPSLPFCFRQRLAYRSGAHTPAGAVFRNRILLKMSGSALSLSFHIRLNERCALTYPLRSALPIPPFPVVLKTPIDSALHRKKTSGYYGFCWLLCVQRYLTITVTPFEVFRTDLPGYHTFLSLHPSAAFTAHDSV